MNALLLATSSVYEVAKTVTLSRIRVQHPVLGRFHKDVRSLDRLLREQGAEDDLLWRETSRRLRRFRFLTSATPLPFDHPFLWDDKAQAVFQRSWYAGVQAYPVLNAVVKSLAEGLLALRTECENPLWAAIQEHALLNRSASTSQERWAVLLADTRSVFPVEALVASEYNLEVLTASQLKDDVSYTDLFVPGISSWFPEYCFTASRARKIHLFQYKWSWDNLSFDKAFVSARTKDSFITVVSKEEASGEASTYDEANFVNISPPEIDWALAFRDGRHTASGGGVGDVRSHLYALEGNHGVWFEDAPDASVQTISLVSTGNNIVRRHPVQKLKSGAFVLLRTGGGGDLIVSVANHMLGPESERLRSLQDEWKRAFRKKVNFASSVEVVGYQLRMYGCRRPSGANIRNWMSERNISPDDPEDFRAVLAVCHLEERFSEFVEAMDKIDSAHRSAGRRISSMILSAVSSKDTTSLRREGVQVFELPQGEGGGSFTAYRLLERSEDTALVPSHRLNQVFTLEN